MVSLIDSSQAVDSSETTLFDESGTTQHYACWIFTDIMGSGDTYVIRIYVQDQATGTERKYAEETLSDAQDPSSFYVPYIATDKYKVTMQKTAGTDRTFKWRRVETP